MIVGTEWLIEAFECEAETLRETAALKNVFSQIVADLDLKTVGEPLWHKFGGEGGITGLTMLTESHLACHTYPEYRTATFNLYCCRTRPEWNWSANLKRLLGAEKVKITKVERGGQSELQIPDSRFQISESKIQITKSGLPITKSKIQNLKSKIVRGEI